MKHLITVFVVLLSVKVSAQKTDLEKFELKGKVKSVQETATLQYITTRGLEKSVSVTTYDFDERGMLKEKRMQNEASDNRKIMIDTFNMNVQAMPAVEWRTVYTYNDKGQLAKEDEYDSQFEGLATKTKEYTYDARGNRITELHYDPREEYGEKTMIKMSYDERGLMTEKVLSRADKHTAFEEKEKEQYKYNADGKMIQKFYYDFGSRKYWMDMSAVYDAAGRMTEQAFYAPDGEIWMSSKVKRDATGRITEHISPQKDGHESVETHEYGNVDNKGNCLKERIATKGRTHLGEDPLTTRERVIAYY